MHYKFKLNDKYSEFKNEYEKCFTKHFRAVDEIIVENKNFVEILQYEKYNSYLGRYEKINAFKKYSYVPYDINKLFLMTCYDVYLIKNPQIYTFWIPLKYFLWMISILIFCILSVGYSEYIKIVSLFLVALNFLYIKFINNLDEEFVLLNESEKHRLIYGNEDNNPSKSMRDYNRFIKSKCEKLLSKIPPELQNRKSVSIKNYIKRSILEDEEFLKKIYTDEVNIDEVLDNISVKEEKRIANHISYEGRLNYSDKRKLKKVLGDTCCACGIKMSDIYGDIGNGYIELHHKIPYSEMAENDTRILTQNDFCVLCPNCHKMVHKLDDAGDIELLSSIVKANKDI